MRLMLIRLGLLLAIVFCVGLTAGRVIGRDSPMVRADSGAALSSPSVIASEILPVSVAEPLPDRQSCGDIRGSDYRSPDERDWFLENCVVVAPAAPAVPAPNPPAIPGAEVPGERWVRVNLASETASAMIGDQVLYTALVTTGKEGWETPKGTFHVLRRVANETMTSASIGAEEEYVLTNVLYTQYFTTAGHALHLNYWRPDDYFGRVASSHGCVGARLADAEFFWRFATYGTRVTID